MGTKHTKPCSQFHERFPYCAHMYEVPILRAFTIVTIILFVLNFLLSAVYFYQYWDFRLLIKNSFLFILTSFLLLNMLIAIQSSESHFEMQDLMDKMWTMKDAESKTVILIQNDIKQIQRTRIIIIALQLLTCLTCIPISGDPREFFCYLYLYEDMDKASWYRYFEWFIMVLKFYVGLISTNPIFMMLTMVGNITYELIILREKIRSIEKTFGIQEIWRFDEPYQKFVELMLKRCIQEHLRIKRFHELLAILLSNYLPLNVLLAVLVFTSFYFNIRMNQNETVLMKSLLILLILMLFSYLLLFYVQRTINESENLHTDLCNCPWFLWNKSNQSTYFTFLIHTKKPLVIRCFGFQYYDYGLLVRIARTTMSLLTAIEQLTV